MQQRTAQLTIFYAGVVNVYDDISLEKVRVGFLFLFENIPLGNHIAGFRSSNMSNIGPISEYFSFTFAGTGYYDDGR